MSLYSSIERLILQTSTEDEYKDVISKRVGHYSLQNVLTNRHTTFSRGESISETDEYPSMHVVDIIPTTTGILTEDSTVIVIPPSASLCSLQWQSEEFVQHDFSRDVCFPPSIIEPFVHIILREDLFNTDCYGDAEFFALLFAESNNVIEISCESYKTCFTVHVDASMNDRNNCALVVGPDVFQNIRRIAVMRSLSYPQVNFCFRDRSFDVPIGWFTVLESSNGESLIKDDVLIASKVYLCPAADDFVLQTIFGESYNSLFALAVQSTLTSFNDRIVSEGDILHVPLCNPDGRRNEDFPFTDILCLGLKQARHKIQHWDGIFTTERDCISMNFFPLCVSSIDVTDVEHKFGRLRIDGNQVTQVAIVSQSFSPSLPCLSPFYCPQKSRLFEVEFKKRVRSCLDQCFRSQDCYSVNLFVAQGLLENMPGELIEDTAKEYGITTCFVSVEGLSDTDITTLLDKIQSQKSPLVLIITGAQTFSNEKAQLLSLFDFPKKNTRVSPKAIFLLCDTIDAVPPVLSARAQNSEGVILCGNPSEQDRKNILKWALESQCSLHHVVKSLLLSLESLASWTTGLSTCDILSFATECVLSAVPKYSLPEGVHPVLSDFHCEHVLQKYLNDHGHNLVSTKLQPVRWSDVGGLEQAKKELQETIQLPILHPELFSNGIKKRAGILFYGPPGCGKTLLAKAVATEMNMNFMSVKGPELINQYVGESERNIRILFQKARDNSPCIIFFDELDALAPARGAKGDAGGAMDRIVSQLLVEVDGVGQKKSDGTDGGQVFIIGATNRPDLLDPSLLRPGRFDRLCYLGIPSTKAEQLYAVRALTRKFNLHEDVSLEDLIDPLDCVYTGADFFALCSDAMMNAVDETLASVKESLYAGSSGLCNKSNSDKCQEEDDTDAPPIKVKMSHFISARNKLKASVTKEDLARYESLKNKFSS